MAEFVTKNEISAALRAVGLTARMTVIVHSSLRSFGRVEGGAPTVIEALRDVLTDGTLVFPTLRQKNFLHAYEDWDIDRTPSDVGLISETFRTMPGVLRSDQETHSVAAIGRDARYLTEGHRKGKPRPGIFGDMCFGYESPWQRMYDANASILMLGVTLVYNTFKHFAEYRLVNDLLDGMPPETAFKMREPLAEFDGKEIQNGLWPFHDGLKTQALMEEHGMIAHARCGECEMLRIESRPFVDLMTLELYLRPAEWMTESCAAWFVRAKELSAYRP